MIAVHVLWKKLTFAMIAGPQIIVGLITAHAITIPRRCSSAWKMASRSADTSPESVNE